MLIVCPVVRLDSLVVKVLQLGSGELASFCDYLSAGVVLDAL